jgi:hypothetical protein
LTKDTNDRDHGSDRGTEADDGASDDLLRIQPPQPGEPDYDEWVRQVEQAPTVDPAVEAATVALGDRLLFSDHARAASARGDDMPLGFANILAVATGEKLVAGQPTGQMVVTVFVARKAATTDVAPEAAVPDEVDGVLTDVVESAMFQGLADFGCLRPVPPGASIAHPHARTGTVGCIVRRDGTLHILSAYHVLANSGAAAWGDDILQPGGFPAYSARHVVARLTHHVRYESVNEVDCALAEVLDADLVTRVIHCFAGFRIGFANRAVHVIPPQRVWKCGNATGLTTGTVMRTNWRGKVDIDGRGNIQLFRNQIHISYTSGGSPFALHGDSGALVAWAPIGVALPGFDLRPVGLLVAGNPADGTAVASPIMKVASELGGFSIV